MSTLTAFYFLDSNIFLLNARFRRSVPSYLYLHRSPPPRASVTAWQCERGRRKRHREIALWFCRYLIINPHWSVSTPGPLFSFHSAAPSDKVPGWLVGGHGGFVSINNTATASSSHTEAGRTPIINTDRMDLITADVPTNERSPVPGCTLLGWMVFPTLLNYSFTVQNRCMAAVSLL